MWGGFFSIISKKCIPFLVLAMLLPQGASAKVLLVVSTDWEGREIKESNLKAIQSFRDEFPGLNVLQFLNAAYFTKAHADPAQVAAKIASALRPGDELGLHIHGWKSLFEASGVKFRTEPTFWGTPLAPSSADRGHEVPISFYTINELRRVIRFSINLLNKNGFGEAKSFRAGGWVASPAVLEAIALEGLTLDSSSVPPAYFEDSLNRAPLLTWLKDFWSKTTPSSQPRSIETAAGTVFEMPDNGALADWVTPLQMVDAFRAVAKLWKKDPQKDFFIQVGFHQETAATYLPRLTQALHRMEQEAEADGIPFENAPLPLSR